MITAQKLRIPVTDRDHSEGPPKAPLQLVEYADYECPYCDTASIIVSRLEETFGKDLRVIFRNFPLVDLHLHALDAAKAAEAAALQGKFWEMHDLLFLNQEELEQESLYQYANQLGLDLKKFSFDFESDRVMQKIETDLKSGEHSGVNGTPTFFINGFRVDFDGSYESLVADLQSFKQSSTFEQNSAKNQSFFGLS